MSDSEDQIDEPADAEILALLDFTPVPRRFNATGGWTPLLQRRFIARLAVHGSPGLASEEVGKDRTGARKLYNSPGAASFRSAWDAAVALAQRRREPEAVVSKKPPSIDNRFKRADANGPGPLPGQVLNEHGEWEDEQSIMRRAEEARDSISRKLLFARRLYLQEICGSPGKRAAFEILTDLPIDWEKAEQLEPQADEPFHVANMRQPDMLLTAENGWIGEVVTHGPDKKAELRKAVDKHREEAGLPPVDWESESTERSDADA